MYSGEYDACDVKTTMFNIYQYSKIIFTWVHNTNTEKIILLDYIGIEGTRFCSEISLTRANLTA
jgi:predicted ATP-grasp superfamily ATP-dependent carboligase